MTGFYSTTELYQSFNLVKNCCYKSLVGDFFYVDSGLETGDAIVFLHGFTGSSRDFFTISDFINNKYRCLMPDLPGHGKTSVWEDGDVFPTNGQVLLLEQWLDFLGVGKFHLFGYSMGGRLALQFAVKNSSRLHSLILVSTTAGIESESVRQARRQADEKLAEKIINSDPLDFLNFWLTQPLFQGIVEKGKDFLDREIARRLPIQPAGLACSLKHFGSGVMPSVWHLLSDIQTPALVIAGLRDRKYLEIASQLVEIMPNAQLKTLETTHAPLIESPDLLWQQIGDFWQISH
ncbi:MAG TPA: alpha/beta fold hydrolase [Leptolyngbyaceae cyanobacterium]